MSAIDNKLPHTIWPNKEVSTSWVAYLRRGGRPGAVCCLPHRCTTLQRGLRSKGGGSHVGAGVRHGAGGRGRRRWVVHRVVSNRGRRTAWSHGGSLQGQEQQVRMLSEGPKSNESLLNRSARISGQAENSRGFKQNCTILCWYECTGRDKYVF
jgi:hypothetical protein